jgi:hypothetical protein
MPKASTIKSISRFPKSDEIQEAMKMAGGSIDAAEYLLKRIKTLADEAKFLTKAPELKANVIAAVEKFVEYVQFKLTANGQPWAGQHVETSDMKNMQKNIAEAAAKELTGKLNEVKLDYAISEKGHYVRGYSSNTGALDSESVASLDKLFNAWLASKDYLVKSGFIYNANDTVQSENTRINPEIIKQLLEDGSLEEFMLSKGVNAELRARDYPGEQKEAQAKQEVSSAIKEADVARVAEEAQASAEAEETLQAGVGTHH